MLSSRAPEKGHDFAGREEREYVLYRYYKKTSAIYTYVYILTNLILAIIEYSHEDNIMI